VCKEKSRERRTSANKETHRKRHRPEPRGKGVASPRSQDTMMEEKTSCGSQRNDWGKIHRVTQKKKKGEGWREGKEHLPPF